MGTSLNLKIFVCVREIFCSFGFALRFIWFKMMMLLSYKKAFDGLRLYAFADALAFFGVATQALSILRKLDPVRYKRAQKFLPNIAYLKIGLHYYDRRLNAFVVDAFKQDDPLSFAGEIVHETTHAYLRSRGLRYEIKTQERHEKLALKGQERFIYRAIELGSSLPEEEKKRVIKEWKEWFSEVANSRWWEIHNTRRRQFYRLKENLGELKGFLKKDN